jgi:hypothetical protein
MRGLVEWANPQYVSDQTRSSQTLLEVVKSGYYIYMCPVIYNYTTSLHRPGVWGPGSPVVMFCFCLACSQIAT